MNKNQVSSIKNTIIMIEEQLKEPINLDHISKNAGISKCHLHRLFKAFTGKSMIAYVRGRKLSKSLYELLNTDMTVLDIACEYAFEYEQSYIRSFQRQFNITPTQYRQSGAEIPIVQKIDINSFKSIGEGLILEPRMIIKPKFYVQGIKSEIIHLENLQNQTTNSLAKEYENDYLSLIANKTNPDVYIGLVIYSSNPEYSNLYMPCTETSVLNPNAPPLESRIIPMQEYAVFRYVGFHSPYNITYEALLNLYDYIFKEWLTTTSYQSASYYHFEKLDLSICSEDYCEMDIYIPITSKA